MRRISDLLRDGGHVTVCVPDHYGRLMGKTRPAADWPRLAVEGLAMPDFHLVCGVEGRPLEGFAVSGVEQGFRNGRLMPDADAAFASPNEDATVIVLAVAETSDGRPVPVAPRAVLGAQLDRLANAGLTARFASELEFYLFEGDDGARRPFHATHGDNDVLVTSLYAPFISDLGRHLSLSDMAPEQVQGEGGAGQLEMNLPPAPPMTAADRHVAFKHVVKARALAQGCVASFMARLDPEQAGSGGHIHLSLRNRDGKNALGGTEKLSALGAAFVGGLVAHTPALTLMHAPLANSYRRLVPMSYTPLAATWGYDNRTAMVRIVVGSDGPRLEMRLPGADVNPYHSYAAILAAGLAGVEAGLDPGPAKQGSRDPQGGPELPADLTEAVTCFAASELAHRAFGAAVHDHILAHARAELAATRRAVTSWEIARGLTHA